MNFRIGQYVKIIDNGDVAISRIDEAWTNFCVIGEEYYWQDTGRRFGRGAEDAQRIEPATEAEIELFG